MYFMCNNGKLQKKIVFIEFILAEVMRIVNNKK